MESDNKVDEVVEGAKQARLPFQLLYEVPPARQAWTAKREISQGHVRGPYFWDPCKTAEKPQLQRPKQVNCTSWVRKR
jgi:hypothetical protein